MEPADSWVSRTSPVAAYVLKATVIACELLAAWGAYRLVKDVWRN